MRKRTIKNVADTIFWYVLYFLPVICFVLITYAQQGRADIQSFMGFDQYMELWGVTSGPIVETLGAIFGDGGEVIQLFSEWGIFSFLQWYVGVYLLHLCVDFLLFIPRLAHKWMNGFTGGGAE